MSGSGNGKIWTGARADQAELRSCDLLGVGEVDRVLKLTSGYNSPKKEG